MSSFPSVPSPERRQQTAGEMRLALEAEIESLAGEIIHAYEALHLVYELGDALTGRLSLPEATDLILETILHTLPAAWGELRLADAEVPVSRRPGRLSQANDALPTRGGHRLSTVLRSSGRVLGSIFLMRPHEEPAFTSDDGKLLDAVGALAANAVRNAQLFDALAHSEAWLRAIMEHVPDGIITVDERGCIGSFNQAAERTFGYSAAEVVGQHVSRVIPEAEWLDFSPPDPTGPRRQPLETVGSRRDGSSFPIELSLGYMSLDRQRRLIASIRDITERKQGEELLQHYTLHDALTGLPNRILLNDRLHQATLAARRDRKPVALLVMDLDRFKDVNDALGHHAGDLVLLEAGHRLRACLREPDTVARLGGDEFAMLLPGADARRATLIAQQLLQALEAPFLQEQHSLSVSASVGIALYPEHGEDAETLFRHADVAMYVAKRARSGYAVYAVDQDTNSPSRLALVGQLRQALEHDELALVYQPKGDLHSGRVLGVEALARWHHPQHGLLPPDQFIPLAEQTGLIQNLSRWVLNAALQQCHTWRQQNLELPVAVNLSAHNFHDTDLPETIAELLARWNLPPSCLTVEITESAVMTDPPRALHVLARLRSLGLGLALDDFGTGHSSLAYLKHLPVDQLKIDRSFVRSMASDSHDAAIVRSSIRLGQDLGLLVVAEGVEDLQTSELLASLGCHAAQGSYVGEPLAPPELLQWLKESRWSIGQREAVG